MVSNLKIITKEEDGCLFMGIENTINNKRYLTSYKYGELYQNSLESLLAALSIEMEGLNDNVFDDFYANYGLDEEGKRKLLESKESAINAKNILLDLFGEEKAKNLWKYLYN